MGQRSGVEVKRGSGAEELPPYPGAPRWVKVFGLVALALVLLAGLLLVSGHHAGGHMPVTDGQHHSMSTP